MIRICVFQKCHESQWHKDMLRRKCFYFILRSWTSRGKLVWNLFSSREQFHLTSTTSAVAVKDNFIIVQFLFMQILSFNFRTERQHFIQFSANGSFYCKIYVNFSFHLPIAVHFHGMHTREKIFRTFFFAPSFLFSHFHWIKEKFWCRQLN